MFVEYVSLLNDGGRSAFELSARNPVLWLLGLLIVGIILWTIKR